MREGTPIDRSVLIVAIEKTVSELPTFKARVARSTAALNQSSEVLATARALSNKFREHWDLTAESNELEIEEQRLIVPLKKAVDADRAAARILPDLERLERCRAETKQVKHKLEAL